MKRGLQPIELPLEDSRAFMLLAKKIKIKKLIHVIGLIKNRYKKN
jgi:hypothetical protein